VCAAAFVVLLALTGWRLLAYWDAVVDDFTDPGRAFGFFTFIAGTNVLGVRLAMDGFHTTMAVLLAVAGALWLVLGYVIPWTAVLGRRERPVLVAANGTARRGRGVCLLVQRGAAGRSCRRKRRVNR